MCIICPIYGGYFAIALIDEAVLGHVRGYIISNVSTRQIEFLKNNDGALYSPFIDIDDRFIK